jgi:cell division transport system permease protein
MENKPEDKPKKAEEVKGQVKAKTQKGSRLKNHLRTTWRHLRRSPYQTLAAVITVWISFWIASMFVMTAAGIQAITRYFESKPQVTAFFKQEPAQAELESLTNKLRNVGPISKINFVSQEQALEIYKEMNKDEPLLLEMVTANILPASLEVSTVNPGDLSKISEVLKSEKNVDEVVYQQDVVESLTKWTNSLRSAGLVLVGSLGLVSFLVILVIVGMKISMHRGEIEIMRLIGATTTYIKLPFIMEGMVYGIMGGLLAWGSAYVVLLYATPYLVDFLQGMPIFPIPLEAVLALLGLNLGAGLIWGGLASWGATQRFLARKRG